MKTLLTLLLLLLLLQCSHAAPAYFSIEQNECPNGCVQDKCDWWGCAECYGGYCLQIAQINNRYMMTCVKNCGEGMFCNVDLEDLCTACSVDYCKICSRANQCEECDTGYYLAAMNNCRKLYH